MLLTLNWGYIADRTSFSENCLIKLNQGYEKKYIPYSYTRDLLQNVRLYILDIGSSQGNIQ